LEQYREDMHGPAQSRITHKIVKCSTFVQNVENFYNFTD
jgi:hypothetical protein